VDGCLSTNIGLFLVLALRETQLTRLKMSELALSSENNHPELPLSPSRTLETGIVETPTSYLSLKKPLSLVSHASSLLL
jgi:hypothetical protein